MPILRFLQIYLYHVHPHLNAVLYRLQRVFRCIAPITPMGNNQDFFIISIQSCDTIILNLCQ